MLGTIPSASRGEGLIVKKLSKKLLAVFLAAVILSGLVSFNAGAANEVDITGRTVAAARDEIQKVIDGLGGTIETVTVTGTLGGATTIMELTIPDNITVVWEAAYSGTANPLLDLKGNGGFEVTGGEISNTSPSSFTAIRANATADSSNGVSIVIRGGVVKARLGTAIEGAGVKTTVTVNGGAVSNEATNNLRPVINMTNPAPVPKLNITVVSGVVSALAASTGAYGYALQTYGDIVINGGTVFTTGQYGRGINLVGIDSVATINDGTIYATGESGVAVSTATTAGVDVTRAKVEVKGGLVYATTGMAIRTTGKESTIEVSGGLVIAYGTNLTGNNNVIFAQNNTTAGYTSPIADGVVIAWNQAAAALRTPPNTYDAGTSTHIIASPATASAVWVHNPPTTGIDGIKFSLNGLTWNYVSFGGNSANADGVIKFTPVTVQESSWIIDRDEHVFSTAVAEWADTGTYTPLPYFATYTSLETQTFKITNNGNVTISGLTATLDNGSAFEIVAQPTPLSIGAGEWAVVTISIPGGYLNSPNPNTFNDVLRVTGTGAAEVLTVNLSLPVIPTHRIEASSNNPGVFDLFGYASGVAYVPHGGSKTFSVKPAAANDYLVNIQVFVRFPYTPPALRDTYDARATYTFTNVIRDMQIHAYILSSSTRDFEIIAYTEDGGGGRFLQPLRTVVLRPGGTSETFNIVADPGFVISHVVVDTVEQTLLVGSTTANYTFNNILANHVITATFERVHYNISVRYGDGGTVSDIDGVDLASGTVLPADFGQDLALIITAEQGYRIGSVRVDGVTVSASPSQSIRYQDPYVQFLFVDRDHDVVVTFVLDDGGGAEPPATDQPQPGDGVSHLLVTKHHIQYVRGVGNNEFHPARDMTRAEVAQMFYNLLLEPDIEITTRFPDERSTAWHEKAVHTLASLGILRGYSDGYFRPEDSVTRAEFVAMAVRFAKTRPEPRHLPFTDVAETHWAYEYINSAVQFGWVFGYSDGSFQPSRHISRAEAVTIVNRMLGRVADKAYIDSHPNLARFSDVPKTHWAYYDIMEAFDEHDYHWDHNEERWHD